LSLFSHCSKEPLFGEDAEMLDIKEYIKKAAEGIEGAKIMTF